MLLTPCNGTIGVLPDVEIILPGLLWVRSPKNVAHSILHNAEHKTLSDFYCELRYCSDVWNIADLSDRTTTTINAVIR